MLELSDARGDVLTFPLITTYTSSSDVLQDPFVIVLLVVHTLITIAMAGDHKCPVCQATFTRPQHVARHMRSREFPDPPSPHAPSLVELAVPLVI